MSDKLENSWKSCTCEIPATVQESWWEIIIKKYNESGRNGHNYEYLNEKLKDLENFKNYIKNLQAFTLGLFFQ